MELFGKIKEALEEAGDIHSPDCCMLSEYGCDTDIISTTCCGNTQFIAMLLKDMIEILSHDMEFKNEEQRKYAVKSYNEALDKQ